MPGDPPSGQGIPSGHSTAMASLGAPTESPDLAPALARGVDESVLRDEQEAGSARDGRPRRRTGAQMSNSGFGRAQPSQGTKQRAVNAICHWYHPRTDHSILTTKAQWAKEFGVDRQRFLD